jgi:3-methyl-2-oxobutanoate hydroxymethyltransferase
MTNNVGSFGSKVTPELIRRKKSRLRITFITAYDFPTAKLVDEAGFDMILVGDTHAEVVLGFETTVLVTFEAMLHHTSAARRAIKRALLVADLPYGSYQTSDEESLALCSGLCQGGWRTSGKVGRREQQSSSHGSATGRCVRSHMEKPNA